MKSQAVHFCSEQLENIRDEMNDWDNCSTINSPADGVVCFLSTRARKLAEFPSKHGLRKKQNEFGFTVNRGASGHVVRGNEVRRRSARPTVVGRHTVHNRTTRRTSSSALRPAGSPSP